MENKIKLSAAPWKYGKDWVYSITYDEALADLERFVIPVHEELGIPGHVEVVGGHIGQVRNLGASSFNGMRHMNGKELRQLVSMGWGAGNHSWSHGNVAENPDLELRQAKKAIEDAIGKPVTLYTAPGDNSNLTGEIIEKLKEYGYLGGMSITDDINRYDAGDLLWINRVPVHEKYWGVFDGAFDVWKRILQAEEHNGWIVDYCHCPLEQPMHPYKDCTQAHHRERLETIASEGKYNCWFANPDDVADYRYMRRHTVIEPADGCEGVYTVRLDSLPEQVCCRELTFLVECAYMPEVLTVLIDGGSVGVYPVQNRELGFTAWVHDGMKITVRTASKQ